MSNSTTKSQGPTVALHTQLEGEVCNAKRAYNSFE
jgi:hypothetical protein